MTPNNPSPPSHNAATVAEIIRKNIEPDTAEDVLAALQKLEGQVITTRLLDKLPGGRVEWRIHRQLGETTIRNRAYLREKAEGVSLTLARSDASGTVVDASFVEKANPSYFKDRRERNALRAKALADAALLGRVAILFSEIETINMQLDAAKQQFAVYVTPGEPLSPDRVELERACGLREKEKK